MLEESRPETATETNDTTMGRHPRPRALIGREKRGRSLDRLMSKATVKLRLMSKATDASLGL